ncbi:MAG TPA: N-acetylmuramoyl-L-alanine amidase [Acidimicrobiales bacterium]|nr:N-acetylmuramoyl-L-alanine amidase [Acidimicrobiales bacterium]
MLVTVALAHGAGARSAPQAARAAAPAPRTRTPLAPASFAPGACVALAPTHGDRHRTVVLDAGHGGIDPGAVGATSDGHQVTEGQLNLPVELDAAELLRGEGFRVVVTRTADTTVERLGPGDVVGGALTITASHADVVARARCADLAGASALVGLYLDAGAPSAAGCVTVYDTARPFAADNERLAGLVQADVLDAMDARGWAIPDEGAVPDSEFGSSVASATSTLAAQARSYPHLLELGPGEGSFNPSPTSMPGAVIEPLFLTDAFEADIAASAAGQHVIAAAVAAAVTTFLTPPAPPPGAAPGTAGAPTRG